MKQRLFLFITTVVLMITTATAGTPLWTFTPLTATTIAISPGTTRTVQYLVTNQSRRAKNLVLESTSGLTQASICNLTPKDNPGSSCTLTITITADNVPSDGLNGGPLLCLANLDGTPNSQQCYQPGAAAALHIFRLGSLSQGGVVACFSGGFNNLIAATKDNSAGIQWGGQGTATGGLSNTNGRANTDIIVACLTGPGGIISCPHNIDPNTYAAGLCQNYEVDSSGNTPCKVGNCYSDWFLPSRSQLNCLYTNRVAIGGFDSTIPYWSSTEDIGDVFNVAFSQRFTDGFISPFFKSEPFAVRCVRTFTP